MVTRPWLISTLILLLAAGGVDRYVHIQRAISPALAEGEQRLAQLPESIGSWVGEKTTVDESLLKSLAAEGGRVLQYRDGQTGMSVLVALLVGHPGLMTDQIPEKTFRNIGFAFDNESLRHALIETRLRIPVPGTLAHMDFWRQDSKVPMRVWHGWYDGTSWSRPDHARWRFLDRPVIYRLQVWSLMATDPLAPNPGALVDPSRQFLIDALPTITKLLHEEKPAHGS